MHYSEHLVVLMSMKMKVPRVSVFTVFFFISTVILMLIQFRKPEIRYVKTKPRLDLKMLEAQLCTELPSANIRRECPRKPIVSVNKLGRLGNQMWEYAGVWAVARATNREPFVPICLSEELKVLFSNITVPTLSEIAHCDIQNFVYVWNNEIKTQEGNILLSKYTQLPEYVAPVLKDVLKIFRFHDRYLKKSQDILLGISKGESNCVFVGVHVRRTDYPKLLMKVWNETALGKDFYLRQMQYFRRKYDKVQFVILSDDPEWCRKSLSGNDVTIVETRSREVDLAVMASCNHTIYDYGSYGTWGAMMAGGETLVYQLTKGTEKRLSSLLPDWHLVK